MRGHDRYSKSLGGDLAVSRAYLDGVAQASGRFQRRSCDRVHLESELSELNRPYTRTHFSGLVVYKSQLKVLKIDTHDLANRWRDSYKKIIVLKRPLSYGGVRPHTKGLFSCADNLRGHRNLSWAESIPEAPLIIFVPFKPYI